MFEAKQAAGEHVPFLEDRPDSLPQNDYIMEAFTYLAQQRWTGHEDHPQAITLADIKAYCDLADITDYDDKMDLMRGVIILDGTAMRFMRDDINRRNKKAQREAKAKSSRAGRGRRR